MFRRAHRPCLAVLLLAFAPVCATAQRLMDWRERTAEAAIVYQLPFSGAPVRIDQGFGGAFSHADPANFYALDFALPERTAVLAARDGVVMEVRDDFREAGRDPARFGNRANLVRIRHADGSMALYAHLAPGGIEVRAGQSVRTGDRLGRSGNTGLSTGPHLHFAVQLNRGMRLVSVPFRMAGPLGELRFAHPADARSDPVAAGSPL